MLKGVL